MSAMKILVVDDDPTALKLVRDQLLEFDLDVVTLDSAREVRGHLEKHHDEYALIVLDINMPHKDGLSLANEIRDEIGCTRPILFVSGDAAPTTRSRVMRLSATGYTDFLEKSKFGTEQLFNSCMRLIRDSSVQQKIDGVSGQIGGLVKTIGNFVDSVPTLVKQNQEAACKAHAEQVNQAIAQATEPGAVFTKFRASTPMAIIATLLTSLVVVYGGALAYTWDQVVETSVGVAELRGGQQHVVDAARDQQKALEAMMAQQREFQARLENRLGSSPKYPVTTRSSWFISPKHDAMNDFRDLVTTSGGGS